jgi:hypothetical protein
MLPLRTPIVALPPLEVAGAALAAGALAFTLSLLPPHPAIARATATTSATGAARSVLLRFM